jgi:hypothetical protein
LLIYFHWTPELITVTGPPGGEPLREPPNVVINGDGKITGLGQDAEAAARAPGMQLMRFPDVATAWEHQRLASALLRYYWMTMEFRDRSNWWAFAAQLWPRLHSCVVIHPAEGAERGLGEEQATWLRGAFRYPQRTFVWRGARLDRAARLADADHRGQWMGGHAPKVKRGI